jgi:PAS domain-containing protein
VANKHGNGKSRRDSKIRVRDKAEEALQHSEQEYQAILKNIVEGYYEVDLAGNSSQFLF